MTKKLYSLITGVVSGLCTIAEVIVVFIGGDYTIQIVSGIGVFKIAVDKILLPFVKTEEIEKE